MKRAWSRTIVAARVAPCCAPALHRGAASAAGSAAVFPATAGGPDGGGVGSGGPGGGGSGGGGPGGGDGGPRAPVSWATLALVTAAGAGAVAFYNVSRGRASTAAQGKVESYGTPLLGGAWALVDGTGAPVTSASFPGRFQLVYFGFTFCPDICPSELVKMARVVDALDAAGVGGRVAPLFVTLDPARDSVEQVGHYAAQFHPRLVGLTGAPGQVAAAAKAFRVYYADVDRPEPPPGAGGAGDEPEDYLVDHSIVMYLMAPDGTLAEFYTQLMTAGEIAARVQKVLAANPPAAR